MNLQARINSGVSNIHKYKSILNLQLSNMSLLFKDLMNRSYYLKDNFKKKAVESNSGKKRNKI